MERRQLEYFLAVARHRSISGAARALGIAQPTLSEAIARAEREQQVPLVTRTARGIELTDAGRALAGPAASVLRAFEDLELAMRPTRELERGTVSVVCPRTLSHDPVATIVGEFRRRHRGLSVELRRPRSDETTAGLVASGQAEVGFDVDDERATMPRERLVHQEIVALVHPSMNLGPLPTLNDLAAHGLILTPRGGVTRQLIVEHLGDQVVEDAVVVETTSAGAMFPLVRAGVGVAFVPAAMGLDAGPTGIETRRTIPPLSRDVWLIHRASLSPAASTLVTVARELRHSGALGDKR